MRRLKTKNTTVLAQLFFFFNNAGLPGGLLYTNLLTPFLYIWLLYQKKQPFLWPYLMIVIPFDIIHLILGVELKSFIISNLLLLSTFIWGVTVQYVVHNTPNMGRVFKNLLLTNFAFTCIACLVYFTPYKELLWYMNKFTESINGFYRLSLLTFEASYYSLIFAPIVIYYLLKVFLGTHKMGTLPTLILLFVPLLLSLSLGVIGALLISFIGFYFIHFKKVFYKKSFLYWLVLVSIASACIILLLALFYPDNPVFIRINNIILGVDTSTKGRTTDSFGIAWKVANERSIWFGSGLGQVKVLAYDVVKKYYNYWGELDVVRIPNSVAETLAIFGIFGLTIRFGLIFYLFFKSRVLSNYYRTVLFIFIFVYQFTGSYITSAVEITIWAMVFSSGFTQFDIQTFRSQNDEI